MKPVTLDDILNLEATATLLLKQCADLRKRLAGDNSDNIKAAKRERLQRLLQKGERSRMLSAIRKQKILNDTK